MKRDGSPYKVNSVRGDNLSIRRALILDRLLVRGTTVREYADAAKVSDKTAYRDLYVLSNFIGANNIQQAHWNNGWIWKYRLGVRLFSPTVIQWHSPTAQRTIDAEPDD